MIRIRALPILLFPLVALLSAEAGGTPAGAAADSAQARQLLDGFLTAVATRNEVVLGALVAVPFEVGYIEGGQKTTEVYTTKEDLFKVLRSWSQPKTEMPPLVLSDVAVDGVVRFRRATFGTSQAGILFTLGSEPKLVGFFDAAAE